MLGIAGLEVQLTRQQLLRLVYVTASLGQLRQLTGRILSFLLEFR